MEGNPVTTPGVPVSPGLPPLERTAQSAIAAARSRLDVLTGKAPQFPKLSEEERKEALKAAEAGGACSFCASLHPGASTAACPRLATFELNGDGKVVKGSFFADGVVHEEVITDGDGKVLQRTTTYHADWDTGKVLAVADAAEEEEKAEDGAPA